MLKITFPDGKHKEYESGITGFDIATDISLSLSKVAVAMTVNGHQKDLTDPINEDSLVNIITLKDDSGLEIMRHTIAAQVLASCLLYTSPSPRDRLLSRMPSSA